MESEPSTAMLLVVWAAGPADRVFLGQGLVYIVLLASSVVRCLVDILLASWFGPFASWGITRALPCAISTLRVNIDIKVYIVIGLGSNLFIVQIIIDSALGLRV